MPRIRKTIEIEASPEHVFNYATNASTQTGWVKFLKQIDITSGDGQSQGTTDRCVVKLGPRAQAVDAVWTEYDAPRAFARKTTGGMEMEGRMTFQPGTAARAWSGRSATSRRWARWAPLVDALFMNRVFQNEIEESLESLKAQLEG